MSCKQAGQAETLNLGRICVKAVCWQRLSKQKKCKRSVDRICAGQLQPKRSLTCNMTCIFREGFSRSSSGRPKGYAAANIMYSITPQDQTSAICRSQTSSFGPAHVQHHASGCASEDALAAF